MEPDDKCRIHGDAHSDYFCPEQGMGKKFWKLFNAFLAQNPGPEGEHKLARLADASIPTIRRWKNHESSPARVVVRLVIDQLEKYHKISQAQHRKKTLTVEEFKLACIFDDILTDEQVEVLMKMVVLNSEEEVLEFCAILHKYRPALEKKLAVELQNRKAVKSKASILKSALEGQRIPPEVQKTFNEIMKKQAEGLPPPRDHVR